MTITNKSIDEMIEQIELGETLDFSLTSLKEYCYPNSPNWDFRRFYNEYVEKIIKAAGLKQASAMSRAIDNAIVYGNKKDLALPLKIICFKGQKGCVFRIEDSGDGFDFEETQRRYKNAEVYYQNGGKGWSAYNLSDAFVSFEGKGNIINLEYLERDL